VIGDLKPYAEYKDSGLPWLGQVPGHWELVPNRGLLRRRKVLVGNRHKDYRLLSLTKQGVIIRDLSTGKGKFSSDMGTSQEVREGDIVFCLFDVPETPRTVGLSRYSGMITGAYAVFEFLRSCQPEYFESFYKAMDDRKLLSPLYSGLRNTIPAERFLGTKTPLPPPDEQAAIVSFLDWANGRLERAIRAKRKVIALLNEQKQAIIHRAVTRGLDPSVPLKDSDVPWLGDIPEHWEVVPLKYLCLRVQNGSTPSTSEPQYYIEGTVPWYGPSSIGVSSWLGAPVRCLTKTAFEHGRARLISGPALLVVVIGATAGKMSLLAGEGATNQQITSFELRHDVAAPEFAIHQLRSSETWLKSTASTATIPILDSGVVNRLPIALPPRGEQERIVASVSGQTLPLATAILRLEREITLLREYRTRLVSDVVTGKLDVREAASRLPDEELLPDLAAADDDADDLPIEEEDAA